MKKIVFLGDSITDAYHNFGIDDKGLGDGYVGCIDRKLNKIEEKVKILNKGHDGFTIQGLKRCLFQDCILQKPDVVSILIGCNDVGVMMNTGRTLEQQGFRENYEKVIREIRWQTDAEIICMAPFIFPYPAKYANWIPAIRETEEIVRDIAGIYKLSFLALHDELQEAAEKYGYNAVTVDGIHLTRMGAEIVAELWMKAIGDRVN